MMLNFMCSMVSFFGGEGGGGDPLYVLPYFCMVKFSLKCDILNIIWQLAICCRSYFVHV